MRIQFEIKEKLPEIVKEIFSSCKWVLKIIEERDNLKRVALVDPLFDSMAHIEIWENEIHIKTAWSNYTYRIFNNGKDVICEYIGAYRGLLEQFLLPTLTPVKNILDTEVLDTSISGAKKETLRNYGAVNVQLKQKRQQKELKKNTHQMNHPTIVYDEFIKEGISMPSPFTVEK